MITSISQAINNLYSKLKALDVDQLNISPYSKKYLTAYINNYSFFMRLYEQLIHKAIAHLNVPVHEAVFVDYGGGCGMLSYIAKEAGFKTVIYNDIYEVSSKDTQFISHTLKIKIDYFITGDVDEFVNEMHNLKLQPDVICSFDVLEHIYNWKLWLETILKMNGHFSLLFMTSANSANPFIRKRIKKLHHQAEYTGFLKDDEWKNIDLHTSYFLERHKIISNAFPELNSQQVELLAIKSRGLMEADVKQLAADFIKTKMIKYEIAHSTNTCDPYTGNWTENLININELKAFVKSKNVAVDVTNALSGYSNSKLKNLVKYFSNIIIKVSGRHNLFFSPVYVLEITKN